MIDPLSDVDVRVLGSLIEKEMTTPDYYPLSLNALTTACNQTSNRDPVVHYDEATVMRAIDTLRRRSLLRAFQQAGSRVMKYSHLTRDALGLDDRQIAVLGVLLLRGPQTLAEVKTRAGRLTSLDRMEDAERVLDELIAREPDALVVRLPRRPGQKEARYTHLLAGDVSVDVDDAATVAGPAASALRPDRLAAVEEELGELRKEVADLRAQLDAFRRQFE